MNQIQFPTIRDETNTDSTHIFEPDSVSNYTWLTKFRFNPDLMNQIEFQTRFHEPDSVSK